MRAFPKPQFRKPTLQAGVVALFTALFLSAALFLRVSGLAFYNTAVFTAVRGAAYFAVLLGLFALLFASSFFWELSRARRVLLLGSYLIYALLCADQTADAFFCLGACLILIPICLYVFPDDGADESAPDLPRVVFILLCSAAGLYFAVLFSIETVARYLTLSTPCFDFGIFCQMFHNMRASFAPVTTCERDGLLSHFAVHASPIYYLFLPFYALFPSPVTLQICQAVLLASGVVPLVFLCRRMGLRRAAALLFVLLYVLYPALGGGTYFDLHENKFLAPLLLWLFWAAEKRHLPLTLLFGLAVCLVKEDAPVYAAFAAVWLLLSRRDGRGRLHGLWLLLLSLAYFFTVTALLDRYGQGVMNYRYANFMGEGQDSLVAVVVNIVKNPAYVIYEIFRSGDATVGVSKLTFALQMLLPLGFLPFVAKRPERLVLLLPFLLVNLMPDYTYQHNIFFQYTYGAFPFLLYASILNYRDLGGRARRVIGAVALCAALLLCTQTVWRRARYLEYYTGDRAACDEVRSTLEGLPADASVSANTFLCAALSERAELYDLDNSKTVRETDYIAVDLRYRENEKTYRRYLADDRYDLVYEKEGRLALFRKRP